VTFPWSSPDPLEPDAMEVVRRRTIFDCCKWDPQVEDVSVLCDFPLVLEHGPWQILAGWAEKLAAEVLAAERELIRKPDLQLQLGLSAPVRKALRQAAAKPPGDGVRVMRFDFDLTTDGWRISEANTDVPGGFIEASGFTRQVAAFYPKLQMAGDPAEAYAAAIAEKVPRGVVALVHATAFTDDRQVMVYLSRAFDRQGLRTCLVSPADLRWNDGRARMETAWFQGPVDLVVRFFPAEWLPNLPSACGWTHFYHDSRTMHSNPATAIVTQSKRFPLVWDKLETLLPIWRDLLPETCDPRQVDWENDKNWVLKPALGRVGEDVALRGIIEERNWNRIRREVRRHPEHWAAQRRFEAMPLANSRGTFYPAIGVFTVAGRSAGVYGRLASRPLIDALAQEVAVLISDDSLPPRAAEEGKPT
jgi:glutathionylspermidine synthase